MTSKICIKCHVNQVISNFHKDKIQNDGYRTVCKTCRKDIRRYHYVKNRDKELDQMKCWRESHPDYMQDYMRNWRENQKDDRCNSCE